MPPRGPQIPLLKRAAILTLHWHAEKSWIEISTILRVHPDTARKICIRAKVSPFLEKGKMEMSWSGG